MLNPAYQDTGDILNFFCGKRSALGYTVPFLEASAAAAPGGVLGDETGVSVPRCLPAVVFRVSRSEPLADKLQTMAADQFFASGAAVFEHSGVQMESASELGCGQTCFNPLPVFTVVLQTSTLRNTPAYGRNSRWCPTTEPSRIYC